MSMVVRTTTHSTDKTIISKVISWIRFCITCWKMQMSGAMEFRASFLIQSAMMFVNNSVWIVFWGIYFSQFPIVKGWEFQDVIMMWAVTCVGFGLAMAFFGNCTQVPRRVTSGDLDLYLVQPKPVLLHMLVSKSDFSAWGDISFGIILFLWVGNHSLVGFGMFVLGCLITMVILVSYMVLVGSLAFFMGNAEGINFQFFIAMITFMTYPTDIFRGLGRIILFTVIPAGFISYMPIGLLKNMDSLFLLEALGCAGVLCGLSVWTFQTGLRKYSSGNLMGMRM